MKHRAQSAINAGSDATLNKSFVGQGMDYSLRWEIYSDLSFFVNYAMFIPGEAYQSNEALRHFVMSGFNVSI